MYDESTGGLMAAPEVDEAMEMCGRYAYCWGRDAAFIADALDQCGLHREVEQFFILRQLYRRRTAVGSSGTAWMGIWHLAGDCR